MINGTNQNSYCVTAPPFKEQLSGLSKTHSIACIHCLNGQNVSNKSTAICLISTFMFYSSLSYY